MNATTASSAPTNIATTSLVTAVVLVVVKLTRWNVDNETLGLLMLVSHAAAHTALPLAKAAYARALQSLQPKAG
jgi:hypothetical protein